MHGEKKRNNRLLHFAALVLVHQTITRNSLEFQSPYQEHQQQENTCLVKDVIICVEWERLWSSPINRFLLCYS